jgi:bifunctional pyridoxal-dependent enzyme with beta-cystathionase and maltose regulon repressor activities
MKWISKLFEKAITPNQNFHSVPYNPVGRVFTRAELERMAEICLRHS